MNPADDRCRAPLGTICYLYKYVRVHDDFNTHTPLLRLCDGVYHNPCRLLFALATSSVRNYDCIYCHSLRVGSCKCQGVVIEFPDRRSEPARSSVYNSSVYSLLRLPS